jgi:hypothetical protein
MSDDIEKAGDGVDLDNVVSLTARHADLAETRPLEAKGYPCSHYPVALIVDCETRTIECKRCKAVVDTFDAIYLLARHEHTWNRVDAAIEQVKRAEARIAEKKQTIRRLDADLARMRRAAKREGSIETDQQRMARVRQFYARAAKLVPLLSRFQRENPYISNVAQRIVRWAEDGFEGDP